MIMKTLEIYTIEKSREMALTVGRYGNRRVSVAS